MTIGLLVIARRNGTCYIPRTLFPPFSTNIIIHLIQSCERERYENFLTKESIMRKRRSLVYTDTFYFISKRYSRRVYVFISPRILFDVRCALILSLTLHPLLPPKKEKQPRLSIVNDVHDTRIQTSNRESKRRYSTRTNPSRHSPVRSKLIPPPYDSSSSLFPFNLDP